MIRLHNRRLRAGFVAFFGLSAALFSPVLGGFGTHFASAAPLSSMPTVSVTVPAGGSAALDVQGFALQPGVALPQGSLSLDQQTPLSDKVRTALYYGVSWGHAQTKPEQVALAIWWTQNGAWLSDNHTIAESIASAAANAPGLPSWNAEGRPIPSLVTQGKLRVSDLTLTPGTLSPAAGSGTLVLQNTGTQDLVVNLPYGTLFTGASGSAIVWSVGQGQLPAQTAPAAGTTAPTSAGTSQPSTTSGNSESNPNNPPVAGTAPSSKDAAPTAGSSTTGATSSTATSQAPQTGADVPDSSGKSSTSGDTSKAAQPESGSQKPDLASAPAQTQNGKSSTGTVQATGNEVPVLRATPTAMTVAGTSDEAVLPTGVPTQVNQVPSREATTQPPLPGGQPNVTPTTGKKDGASPTSTVPPKVAPTEPPKEAPTSVPSTVPIPPPGPIVVPTIIAGGTGSTDGGGSASGNAGGTAGGSANNQVIQPLPEGQGSPPTGSPATGGGPSPVPVWLTLLSTIMVLGGWTLRRNSNVKSEPVPIRVETPGDPGD